MTEKKHQVSNADLSVCASMMDCAEENRISLVGYKNFLDSS